METETLTFSAAMHLIHRDSRSLLAAITSGTVLATRGPRRSWRIDRASLVAWSVREPSRILARLAREPIHHRNPDLLTLGEASRLSGYSPDVIRNAVEKGTITGTIERRGSQLDRASVLAFAAARTVPTVADDDAAVIIDAVARRCHVDAARICTPTVERPIARARVIACAALVRSGWRPGHVARIVGRDHSTVLAAVKRVNKKPEWLAIATACAVPDVAGSVLVGAYPLATRDALTRHLTHVLDAYPPADARAVLAYVRGTLLCHTTAPGPLCAHGLWLLATQPRLYRVVVDRLTRSGYGADAGRIDYQIQKLGYRRSA